MFYSVLLGRYLFCCSYTHNVAPKGKFIAFVSSEAETDQPAIELKPGIDLLGPVDEIFFDIYDRYEPVNEPTLDNCFVSTVSLLILMNICAVFWLVDSTLFNFFFWQSYDATTHFESTVDDVLNMYTLITGKVCFMPWWPRPLASISWINLWKPQIINDIALPKPCAPEAKIIAVVFYDILSHVYKCTYCRNQLCIGS